MQIKYIRHVIGRGVPNDVRHGISRGVLNDVRHGIGRGGPSELSPDGKKRKSPK